MLTLTTAGGELGYYSSEPLGNLHLERDVRVGSACACAIVLPGAHWNYKGVPMSTAQSRGRWGVFFYCILVLAGLIALAILYGNGEFNSITGSIPKAAFVAAWAGALGGIAISFKGVFDHPVKQDPQSPVKQVLWTNELLPWHLGRPFTGIIVGIFVYVALQATYPNGHPSSLVLAAAAFVLGTQERAFFAFIKQIGAVVVSIPQQNSKSKSSSSDS